MNTDFERLVPFVGMQAPGFHFTSGDYMQLVDWDETPFELGPYRCVWHIDADDVRTLYADPKAVGPVVRAFHEFDRVVGAEIRYEWPDPLHLQVTMKAEDGDVLQMEVWLEETAGTRLLRRIGRSVSHEHYPPAVVQKVGDALVRRILTGGGGASIGQTETGRTFDFTQPDRLLVVREMSGTWNGTELKLDERPTREIDFGDVPAAKRPYVYLGTALLERGPEMELGRQGPEAVRAA